MRYIGDDQSRHPNFRRCNRYTKAGRPQFRHRTGRPLTVDATSPVGSEVSLTLTDIRLLQNHLRYHHIALQIIITITFTHATVLAQKVSEEDEMTPFTAPCFLQWSHTSNTSSAVLEPRMVSSAVQLVFEFPDQRLENLVARSNGHLLLAVVSEAFIMILIARHLIHRLTYCTNSLVSPAWLV